MSNQYNSPEVIANSNYSYDSKSEAERGFSFFDAFKKDADNTKSSLFNDAQCNRQPLLTMSSMGKLGRFGNQLFQYAFLRICAEKSGAKVECPPWIGQALFGHNDAPISKHLPPAVERKDVGYTLFDVIPEFIPYLEKLADSNSSRIGSEVLETGLANVDIWGYFQIHTRYLKSNQQYFRSLFQPVSELKSALEDGLSILRSKGKTIVGIHIRRGDYIKDPLLGYTLVFPIKWYCEWLAEIWDKLENPVLFLCSDDLDSIIDEFDKFSPVTAKDLNVKLPERVKDLNIEFYIDFFMLSKCDVVVASNSSFSFVACMMNVHGKIFVRPHWDFSTKFAVFDPWDSEPLLWLGGQQSKFVKSLPDALYITYVTQSFWAMLKCLFICFPKSIITGWAIRAYLSYQIEGIFGVIKRLLYTLGWRSV